MKKWKSPLASSLRLTCIAQMAKVLGASKVTVRYQVTIPADVRELLKIKEGQTLVFAEEDDRVFITTEVR